MPRPEDCLYTKDHEWLHVEGDVARVGITDFAQNELGDIVYVDLGDPGRDISAGEELGTIESVKAVAEVFAPVRGQILEINQGLADAPERVNEDPLGEGWLVAVKLSNPSEVEKLMDYSAYKKYLEEEGH